MDIIELVDEFLKTLGLSWVDKKFTVSEVSDKMVVSKKVMDKDIEKHKSVTIQANVISLLPKRKLVVDLEISVDLLKFKVNGVKISTPITAEFKDEYERILSLKNLDNEWIKFCLTKKGLVYEAAAKEYARQSINDIKSNAATKRLDLLIQLNNLNAEEERGTENLLQSVANIERTKQELN